MSGFVLGITAQLVVIDLNRCLSWIVRNLTELLHHSNWTMEYDGSEEHGIIIPAMVSTV